MRAVEMTMGGILVSTGVLFITGGMRDIANWLLQTFPVFSTIG
jgi:cytochrome c-type biogenesis protein